MIGFIGALLLNPGCRICEGAKVVGLSRLATFLIGGYCVGSMLDPLGSVIFNSRTVGLEYRWVIESPSPGIISRQSVYEPLQTGILAIDSMIPVGRGQRELIVGDRQTGKTSIGVDTILNQRSSLGASSSNSSSNVMCVYVPIGQKASSILEIFIALAKRDALFYVSVLVASASSSAVYPFHHLLCINICVPILVLPWLNSLCLWVISLPFLC
jgi:F-type H+-transporting ATPase subunit alpha